MAEGWRRVAVARRQRWSSAEDEGEAETTKVCGQAGWGRRLASGLDLGLGALCEEALGGSSWSGTAEDRTANITVLGGAGQSRCNLEEEGSGWHVAALERVGEAGRALHATAVPLGAGRALNGQRWQVDGHGLEGAEGLDVCATRRDGQQSGGHCTD